MSEEKTCPVCDNRLEGDTCSFCPPSYAETIRQDSETPVSWTKRKQVMDRLFQKTGDKAQDLSDYVAIPEDVREALGDDSRRLNQYVLVEKVGEGGMGVVWKAWDTELARWVAIKFLHSSDEISIGRFVREAQLSAQLRHANIAGIHEVKQYEEKHFLAMDYIEGVNLREASLSLRESLGAFAKACRAVQFAHERSIIHRDIKPANIMLGKDGEPYVTDFGLAKILRSESSISASGTVMGSPVYMAPEQALGETREVDALSDVYSLGATLYTMLAGKPPFEEESLTQVLIQVATKEPPLLREINPDVPIPVEAIIRKAMSKAKMDRYGSAAELAEDVEKFLRDETVSARAPSSITRVYRKFRRNPWPVVALVTILVAAGIVGGVVNWDRKPVPSPIPAVEPSVSFPPELSFGAFRSSRPGLIGESRGKLAKLSDADALAWVSKEINHLPKEIWPKADWLDRKKEAVRIRAWCLALLEILEGEGEVYAEVRRRLQEGRNRFLAVADYRGTITLRLYITPYADLRDLSIGKEKVFQDGKPADPDFQPEAEGYSTPLVLKDLKIGDYTLTVTHPKYGTHTIPIEGKKLQNGKTYLVAGSLDQPESIRLRLP